ncbi:hypothetical protein SSAG_05768 [Streptomyces sp. Mg1]|nr:hypothetical protein SSAG_05768 [Streptomyces sp. Mg1]
MHLVRREVDVIAVEDLRHHTALGGHTPATPSEPFQQVTHIGFTYSGSVGHPASACLSGILSDTGLASFLTWILSIVGSVPSIAKDMNPLKTLNRLFRRPQLFSTVIRPARKDSHV